MIISTVPAGVILWDGKPHLVQGMRGGMEPMVTCHPIPAAAQIDNHSLLQPRLLQRQNSAYEFKNEWSPQVNLQHSNYFFHAAAAAHSLYSIL